MMKADPLSIIYVSFVVVLFIGEQHSDAKAQIFGFLKNYLNVFCSKGHQEISRSSRKYLIQRMNEKGTIEVVVCVLYLGKFNCLGYYCNYRKISATQCTSF